MTHHSNHQKPHCTQKLEHRQSGHGPQNNLHVDQRPLGLRSVLVGGASGRCIVESLQTSGTQDNSAESEVTEHPCQHDSTSESLVIICLAFLFRDVRNFLGGLCGELYQLGLVLSVQVTIILGDVDVDLTARLQSRRRQLLGLVVTLGTPCDIVGIAESVDVENVDVGRGKEDVLDELELMLAWLSHEKGTKGGSIPK